MGKIILSADSTCDLGPELKERYDVHYYPYHIIFRDKDYLDNVTIFPEDLYAGYYEDGSLPKTTAINVQEYYDYFKPFVDDGYEVIHLNLGHALSSAHENCKEAASMLEGVYVVDSQNLSTGIALQIIKAGDLIEAGVPAAEVARQIEDMRERVHSSFILDTLDFMAAGGRCPSVLAYVGGALKLKPEILVDNTDGSMSMGKIYRGKLGKALEKYIKDTVARYPDIITDHVFLTHSGVSYEIVEECRKVTHKVLDIADENIHVTRASCTISSHCGPGTLGILFVTES